MMRALWRELKNDKPLAFLLLVLVAILSFFAAAGVRSYAEREGERLQVWEYTQGDTVVYASDNLRWHRRQSGVLELPTSDGIVYMSPQFGPIRARRVQ